MGVNDMFDPSLADLSNMTEESGYYISDVTQKAYISIDEKGTSAGAISEVDAVRSIEDDKKEFIDVYKRQLFWCFLSSFMFISITPEFI